MALNGAQFGRVLSYSDLAGELNDPEIGGFTVSTRSGHRPSTGWMVSIPGHEETFEPRTGTPGDLMTYAGRKHGGLREEGNYLGGWRSDAGKNVVDVSRRYDDTPRGHSESRAAQVTGRQEASFHLTSFETEHNPFHPTARANTGKAPHELADAAMKNPQFALRQPEVKAWIKNPKKGRS